jgi:putative addiction module component (TIGR02574 family)
VVTAPGLCPCSDHAGAASAACYPTTTTRPELAAAIRELPDDEKLELLGELWDSLDHATTIPEWHKEELGRRLDETSPGELVPWSEAKARILGSK